MATVDAEMLYGPLTRGVTTMHHEVDGRITTGFVWLMFDHLIGNSSRSAGPIFLTADDSLNLDDLYREGREFFERAMTDSLAPFKITTDDCRYVLFQIREDWEHVSVNDYLAFLRNLSYPLGRTMKLYFLQGSEYRSLTPA